MMSSPMYRLRTQKSSLLVLLALVLTVQLPAQQNANDAVRLQAERNSALADLETARQQRDRAIAERWQDKKQANDFRESYNQKYQVARENMDMAAAAKNRVLEELRALKADMEPIRADVEKARSEFAVLAAQDDKVEVLERELAHVPSFGQTERISLLNNLKQMMTLYRDKPSVISDSLFAAAIHEMKFTRRIETEQKDLLFSGQDAARGYRTRLGGVGGLQFEPDSGRVAVLLAANSERGRVFTWSSGLAPGDQEMIRAAYDTEKLPDSALVWVPVDVLLSTSLSTELTTRQNLTWTDKAGQFLKDGGVLMWPILGLFILALIFVIERLVVWTIRKRTSFKKLDEIYALCEAGEKEKATELAGSLKGSVGRVVSAVMKASGRSRAVAEKAVQEVLAREIPALERRLSTIGVLGNAAPLLGLLGTVYGMIQLFEVITLYGTSDPKLLAGGISVALVTTETGLAVAIPVQLLHNFVSNRMERLIGVMEQQALRFLNILWLEE